MWQLSLAKFPRSAEKAEQAGKFGKKVGMGNTVCLSCFSTKSKKNHIFYIMTINVLFCFCQICYYVFSSRLCKLHISILRYRSTIYSILGLINLPVYRSSVAVPGFPVGGMDLFWGAWTSDMGTFW